MKIALVSDEWHPINEYVCEWLMEHGYECLLFGSYQSKKDEPWVNVTAKAAKYVANNKNIEGVFFCWSGTGACMVANKINGIRAALCNDAETVELARVWNHANVLVLSNRTLNQEMADCILTNWFKEYDKKIGEASVLQICNLEQG